MRALHFALVMLGNIPIFIAYLSVRVAMFFYVLADKVMPWATTGNCWSYVLPLCWKFGGHAAIRPVQGTKFLWGWGTPFHVSWVPRIENRIEQTEPNERYEGRNLLWRWLYFDYHVKGRDEKRPPPWNTNGAAN